MTTAILPRSLAAVLLVISLPFYSDAQTTSPRIVTSESEGERFVKGRIVIAAGGRGEAMTQPAADLGKVQAGEVLKVELELVNETGGELVIEKIINQVGRAIPDHGTIKQGESLKFNSRIPTSPRPTSPRTTYFLELRCKDREPYFFKYQYSFPTHVGVAQDRIVVPLQGSAPIDEVPFEAPFVIGEELHEAECIVSMEGIAGELQSEIDRDASKLRCRVKLESPMERDRLRGQLVVQNLVSGLRQETPILLRRDSDVEVLPTYLQFVSKQGNEQDEGYVATVYVRKASADPGSKFDCEVEATLAGSPIGCQVESIQHNTARCQLTINAEQLAAVTADTAKEIEFELTIEGDESIRSIPVSVQGESASGAAPINAEFVVDAIKTGVLAMQSLAPLDVVGETISEKQFADEALEVSERKKFRLFIDRERQLLIYGCETRPDRRAVLRGQDPTGTTSVSYHRFIVDGKTLYDSGSPPYRGHPRESFDEAIRQTAVPGPGHWGVVEFPGSGAIPKFLENLSAEAASGNSLVSVSSVAEGLRVTLRSDTAGSHLAGIWSWEYQLPSFMPTRIRRQRIIDGAPSSSLEQTMRWGNVQGVSVPVSVSSQAIAIRRLNDEARSFELGQRFNKTSLRWISVGSRPLQVPASIHTDEQIKHFIEQGQRQTEPPGE